VPLPQGQVLRNVQELYRREGEVGYATSGHRVVQDLRQCGEVHLTAIENGSSVRAEIEKIDL
jgi:hypothetical protein